jgi:hypothetical protein
VVVVGSGVEDGGSGAGMLGRDVSDVGVLDAGVSGGVFCAPQAVRAKHINSTGNPRMTSPPTMHDRNGTRRVVEHSVAY